MFCVVPNFDSTFKKKRIFLFTDFVQNLKRSKDLKIGRLFSFVTSTGK